MLIMGNKLHTSNFVSRLRALRDSMHWTQQELADNINVGLKTVRNWEKEQSNPACNGMRLDNFISLCEKFECDPEYLISDLPTRRKVNADIISETGLSELAIEHIVKIKEKENTVMGSAKIMLLNAILEDDSFMKDAANILYALRMIPENATVKISLYGQDKGSELSSLMSDSSDDLRQLYKAELQNIIFSFLSRQLQK